MNDKRMSIFGGLFAAMGLSDLTEFPRRRLRRGDPEYRPTHTSPPRRRDPSIPHVPQPWVSKAGTTPKCMRRSRTTSVERMVRAAAIRDAQHRPRRKGGAVLRIKQMVKADLKALPDAIAALESVGANDTSTMRWLRRLQMAVAMFRGGEA